jgi:hypothetical protein
LAKSFSAFFALPNADLADFSALTLAVVAASKAVLEALSSASSDAIRALAAFRAPELNKEERKSQAKKQRQACKDEQVLKKRDLPSEALATFRYSTHSLPKSTNLFIRFYPENRTWVSTHKN